MGDLTADAEDVSANVNLSVMNTRYSRCLMGTRLGRVLLVATLTLACAVGASLGLQGPQMASSSRTTPAVVSAATSAGAVASSVLAPTAAQTGDRAAEPVGQQAGQQGAAPTIEQAQWTQAPVQGGWDASAFQVP